MTKISVIGGPGSGKSTFARAVADVLDGPHIELDALWWGPNWTPVALSVFQRRVRDAMAAESWVLEGYYLDEAARPLIWPVADIVVWLDLPRRKCVPRALRRSAARVVARTDLWGTNRQSASALTPLSVARFIRRWPTYPARIEQALAADALDGKMVVRLRSDAAVREWLADWD